MSEQWSPDQQGRDMIVPLLALPDPRPVMRRMEHEGIVGPLGVHPEYQGRGVGTALLFQCLLDLRARGYVYAIVGAVGPAAFYEKTCGALLLPAEWPSHDAPMRL